MVDPTIGAMLVLGTTFVLGALAGQWDTKRTMKLRDRSLYEAYEKGRSDQARQERFAARLAGQPNEGMKEGE